MDKTVIRKIGNSFGVILGKKLLDQTGMNANGEVQVEIKKGAITIRAVSKRKRPNLDVKTWDKQFKQAIKKGQKPENSMLPDSVSAIADKAWNWG